MRVAAVLTDLDGTLLDHGGVLGEDAREAVCELRSRGIPVVPLTSKTEVELREMLRELDLGGIGGFENGAGIISPGGVEVSEKAVGVGRLGQHLADLSSRCGAALTPVSELSVAQIRRITGLPREKVPAMLARRFGLPFLAPEGAEGALAAAAARMPGVRLTRGGLFWHLSGPHGKEDALALLLGAGLVSRPLAGLGDAPNDAGFLARCDIAVLVPQADGGVEAGLAAAVPLGREAPFPAGRGWAATVGEILREENR
ncbi:MAG: HAD hydrolase family protein [Holophagales bacterium]|nr:HAD hydrolase family protein [Holophagales bacterium]